MSLEACTPSLDKLYIPYSITSLQNKIQSIENIKPPLKQTDMCYLQTKKYVGITETSFKQRYYNHLTTFKHESNSNTTELSKHIWKLKNSNITYNIKWSILKQTIPSGGRRCSLCTWEKCFILY